MNLKIIVAVIIFLQISLAIYSAIKKKQKKFVPTQAQQTFFDTLPKNEKAEKTEQAFKASFDKNKMSSHWNFFKAHLRPEILMLPKSTTELELKLGQSKIGGQPDLPANTEWFKEDNGKPLSFIAQINLAEVASFDKLKQLPAKGMLYFFYSAEQEAWGFDFNDKDKFKVFFFDGELAALLRQDFPKDLDEHARYKPCRLSFQAAVSLPYCEQDYVVSRLSKKEMDKYIDITAEEIGMEVNKLLGHSDNIQGPMELECELVTNGLYCGDATGYNDPKAKTLEKNKDNWILLLQIDSNDEAGMMWGDVGRLYFWIKKEDLKNRKFDKC